MTQTRSRDIILREEEYTPLLATSSRDFGGWVVGIADRPELLRKAGTVAKLIDTAHRLETFLDDHGARQNRTFATLRELVASTRGLATVKANGLHLLSRLARYITLRDGTELTKDLEAANEFLDESLTALARRLIQEARDLGIEWEPIPINPGNGPHQRRLLPRNLDGDFSVDEQEHIAEIGARFLHVVEASRSLDLSQPRPLEELAEFAAEHATEERCRWYESAVHNIQSMYDTYVLGTPLENEHEWLRPLRGAASVAFHLLEMATGLSHFYERHESEIRHEQAQEAIATLVAKQRVLDVAINTCIRHAYLFVDSASEVAERILETFVPHGSERIPLPEGITLHARPLALIAQIARHYGTPLEISIEGESCSAQSLMALILLGGKHPRPREIEASGDQRALADLKSLFAAGLGETSQALPAELAYLRTSV